MTTLTSTDSVRGPTEAITTRTTVALNNRNTKKNSTVASAAMPMSSNSTSTSSATTSREPSSTPATESSSSAAIPGLAPGVPADPLGYAFPYFSEYQLLNIDREELRKTMASKGYEPPREEGVLFMQGTPDLDYENEMYEAYVAAENAKKTKEVQNPRNTESTG